MLTLFFACALPGQEGTETNRPGPAGDHTTADDTASVVDSDAEAEEAPDLPMGYDDAQARKACELQQGSANPVIAATSAAEAAQNILVPSEAGDAWQIDMPESGNGFAVIEVPDWMVTVRFFADDLVEYTVYPYESSTDPEDLTGLRNNGSCPEARMSDARWAFHEWGSYVVEVEEGRDEVWLALVKEE